MFPLWNQNNQNNCFMFLLENRSHTCLLPVYHFVRLPGNLQFQSTSILGGGSSDQDVHCSFSKKSSRTKNEEPRCNEEIYI